MKYEAKLPKKNVNVTHQKPLSELLTLLGGVLVILFLVYKILDVTLDIAVTKMSPETEKKIFSSLGDEMFKEYEKDEKLQSMVNDLSKCANMPYPLQIRVAKEKELNAFAYPGGYIIVFSKLIKTSKSQNSLAFVLAHEIGHFKNRDHLRAVGKSALMSILFSVFTNGDTSALFSYINGIIQNQYSQNHESQADGVALDILHCYYGHVGGADEFFKQIQKDENANILDYFSTHPPTKQRIDKLHELSLEKGYESKQTLPMWKNDY